MPATPLITLTATLDDISGVAVGSVANPSRLRIALCGFGPTLPRIAGTAMVAKPGPFDYLSTGSPLSIPLWGNDVITPANTYYQITVLDEKLNILQTGMYQFSGSGTIDLSVAPQLPLQPIIIIPTPTVNGSLVVVPFSATPIFDTSLVPFGIITFEITLTGNVTSSTMPHFSPGQFVCFSIIQDATGGRSFVWPTNVKNPTLVDTDPSSHSVQVFYTNGIGNLYPMAGAAWT